MGHAERVDPPLAGRDYRATHDIVTPAARSRCLESPHCLLPDSLRRVLGDHDGLWLHYGPIGTTLTPLAFHRGERAPLDRNAGHMEVETSTSDRVFDGCHLDLYCLEPHPGGQPRRHIQPLGYGRVVLWCVYAVAWNTTDGPHVTWKAPGLGLPNEGYAAYSGLARPTAAVLAEQAKLADLLAGAGVRRGRPPRWRDPIWRELTTRAVDQKRRQPGIPWDDIAAAVGISPSTLREYRRMLRREHDHGADLHLLDGGES